MASGVVTQLRPTLTPSISPRRKSRAIKLGVSPLIREASVTEMSLAVRSLTFATLSLVSAHHYTRPHLKGLNPDSILRMADSRKHVLGDEEKRVSSSRSEKDRV